MKLVLYYDSFILWCLRLASFPFFSLHFTFEPQHRASQLTGASTLFTIKIGGASRHGHSLLETCFNTRKSRRIICTGMEEVLFRYPNPPTRTVELHNREKNQKSLWNLCGHIESTSVSWISCISNFQPQIKCFVYSCFKMGLVRSSKSN